MTGLVDIARAGVTDSEVWKSLYNRNCGRAAKLTDQVLPTRPDKKCMKNNFVENYGRTLIVATFFKLRCINKFGMMKQHIRAVMGVEVSDENIEIEKESMDINQWHQL